MPYLTRDGQGVVTGISQAPQRPGDREVAPTDPELIAFLHGSAPATPLDAAQVAQLLSAMQGQMHRLEQSDLDFIRVLEDLIDLLVGKELLLFSELPAAAQQKLIERRRMRDETRDPSLVVEGGQIL